MMRRARDRLKDAPILLLSTTFAALLAVVTEVVLLLRDDRAWRGLDAFALLLGLAGFALLVSELSEKQRRSDEREHDHTEAGT